MIRPLVVALVLAVSATGCGQDQYSDCNQEKDPDLRIRGCTQVIERGTRESLENRSFAYNNRGGAYADKGEFDRAIADYTKAIGLYPNDAIAYNNRGSAYYRKGEFDRAIADYTKAIKLDPKYAIAITPVYADAYNNRGVTYEKKGDEEQAIADFRKALAIDPSHQDAKKGLRRLGVTP